MSSWYLPIPEEPRNRNTRGCSSSYQPFSLLRIAERDHFFIEWNFFLPRKGCLYWRATNKQLIWLHLVLTKLILILFSVIIFIKLQTLTCSNWKYGSLLSHYVFSKSHLQRIAPPLFCFLFLFLFGILHKTAKCGLKC